MTNQVWISGPGNSRPGWKTTEFWLTVATAVAAMLATVADLVPAEMAGMLIAISNGLYAISRGLAKKGEKQ